MITPSARRRFANGSHLTLHEHGETSRNVDVTWLRGKAIVTLLGVGNPRAIIKRLETDGAKVMANIPAGDHEQYDRAKMNVARGLCDGAEALVMTGKDWVKARKLIEWDQWPVPIVVPHLELKVFEGARELQELILRTVENHGNPDTPSAPNS